MIRLLTTSAGVLAAGTVAAYEVAASSSPPVIIGWSLMAGVAGAGATWGAFRNQVKANTAAIETEKRDREKADAELKADVNRGFDGIKADLNRQTDTFLAALERNRCRHGEDR